MDIIKNIVSFIKRIFNKHDNIKMIEAPKNIQQDDKMKFINSLKVNTQKKLNKKRVETLTCFGDGLGIQTKISS